MIVAGPGTGKTKTLTARIAYLLSQGVSASSILALTFTNKAASEMRERVGGLATASGMPAIATFHALCLDILRREQKIEVQFATDAHRAAAIKEALRRTTRKGLTQREAALHISRQKGAISPSGEHAGLVAAYNARLNELGVTDFDDLILKTYNLLRQNPYVRDHQRARYAHILIDEFQDTSELQWALVQLLRGSDSVFVIGDPKQSIYGFRGVTRDMFEVFRANFQDCLQVTLDTNYRSRSAIVSVSNAIFPNDQALRAHHEAPGVVRVMQTLNEYVEADAVVRMIEEGVGGTTMLNATSSGSGRFCDFAIVYRTHRVAKVVEQRLYDSGIPYQVVGEGSPYDQPEIRAVIDSLLWLNGGDALPRVKGLNSSAVQGILKDISTADTVSRIAETIAERLYGAQDDTRKKLQLHQFIGTLVRFASLEAYAAYFESLTSQDFYDHRADAVTLLTIHASKGLEFEHVIVLAAEEGVLPHIRKSEAPDIDEERRLFYVALTRAKQELTILHAKKRSGAQAEVSRFVAAITEDVLPRVVNPFAVQAEKRIARRQQKAKQATLF